MATNIVIADGVQPTGTTPVTVYSVASNQVGARVIAFTAYNPTATPANLSVYIIAASGGATAQYKIIDTQPLAAHETIAFPELINQLIPTSGSIAIQSDTANTIAVRASGILF